MKKEDVVVVGAGAAGLCAAIEAARADASVLVLERMDKPAKKILATGNGKCNYTNRAMRADCYRGSKNFIQSFLECCPWEDTVAFFAELGIWPKERDGYFYPNSEQAASVAKVLLDECASLGVNIALSEPVLKAKADSGGFIIQTKQRRIAAGTLILAAGGRAYPKLGSDGSGYGLVKSFGHTVTPVVPALCGLWCDGLFGMKPEKFWKQISGVRADAKVTLFIDGKAEASNVGQIQLTGYGISGIPVFQVSRFGAYALKASKPVKAVLDFFPDDEENKLFMKLKERMRTAKEKTMLQFLTGMVNSKLIPVFLRSAGLDEYTLAKQLKNSDISRLVGAMKRFELSVIKTNSFDEAQVCAGGVSTTEVHSATMASKKVRGLFIAGELLDVDGICGGYNLHFAFQSGRMAGRSAAALVKGGNRC